MAHKCWLMKSEPDVYSIDDLQRDQVTAWEGVRNYQARNFMMKDMQIGDQVLFYHSNATPPGIAGLAKVVSLAKADRLQFDKKSEYFDPKATPDTPRWYCIDVGFAEKFLHFISLDEIRNHPKLQSMLVIKKGQRLSIQEVSQADFALLCKLGRNS